MTSVPPTSPADKRETLPRRTTWLTTYDLHRLDLAVAPLRRLCPGIYLVGTVMSSPDWRDVDVRMIMADDEFDATFGNPLLWETFCLTATSWLRSETGLPTTLTATSCARSVACPVGGAS